jgi:hypothetical protein
MKRTDFTNLGGLRFTQNRLEFLQQSFAEPLAGLAALCGNKTIVCGVEVNGSNVTNGWIVYDNELINFIGGSLGPKVVISTITTPLEYGNAETHNVHFDKRATCGVVGDFDFSELVRLSSLQNIWQPGDLKMKYVTSAYIAANFDVNGFGQNKEAGWRILSAAHPGSAGKAFVNYDPADAKFDEPGKTFGSQTHSLTVGQLPQFRVKLFANVEVPDYTNLLTQFPNRAPAAQTNDGSDKSYAMVTNASVTEATIGNSSLVGNNEAHNIIQPSFTVLTLIKL